MMKKMMSLAVWGSFAVACILTGCAGGEEESAPVNTAESWTSDDNEEITILMYDDNTPDVDNLVLKELREIQRTLTGTDELEAEQKQLAEQMNADADAVQELIAQNARVAQDQTEYNLRYDALVSRFDKTKERYEQVTAEIALKGVRRREFGRFIKSVENLPEIITRFDEALWGSLVEKVTVYSKDRIVFTMTSGMEIEV